jgi:hypothetical protein
MDKSEHHTISMVEETRQSFLGRSVYLSLLKDQHSSLSSEVSMYL